MGLKPLPMKAPHVELQDFDNDGWPDLLTSIVKFAGGQPYPVIFKNLGVRDGLPRFHEDALAVNDFPTADEKKMGDVGKFFAKMERDKKVVYMAPGPTCDYDRDGRLDVFLPNWWVNSRSLLLHNETRAGNWLQVTVRGDKGVNRMGIGSVVRLYEAGKLGRKEALSGAGDRRGLRLCVGPGSDGSFRLGQARPLRRGGDPAARQGPAGAARTSRRTSG